MRLAILLLATCLVALAEVRVRVVTATGEIIIALDDQQHRVRSPISSLTWMAATIPTAAFIAPCAAITSLIHQ